MDTELVKGSETRTKGSSKRAGEELESKNLKKQKLNENVEAEVDDVSKNDEQRWGGLLGLKDFKMILRVTTAQLQLLSDYYCWKEYADRDEIKD
ncbi:hypothetical protein Tco_0009886 [Tanacetum coccineum]